MKTKIEKHIIRNHRMLNFVAVLFFVGAVFQIAAEKWPEGIIYFAAAVCFASLERACSRKADETMNNNETTDYGEGDNE